MHVSLRCEELVVARLKEISYRFFFMRRHVLDLGLPDRRLAYRNRAKEHVSAMISINWLNRSELESDSLRR